MTPEWQNSLTAEELLFYIESGIVEQVEGQQLLGFVKSLVKENKLLKQEVYELEVQLRDVAVYGL